MVDVITELELDRKYPEGTPHWRKDAVERYFCTKHNLLTVYVRDAEVAAHVHVQDECY